MDYVRSAATWLTDLSPAKKFGLGAGLVGLSSAYALSSFFSQSFAGFRCRGEGRVVVISGCDSGFGHLLARSLDEHGFCVYALCFTEKGVSDMRTMLSSGSNVIQFDITKQECIDSLRERLDNDQVRIWALVNNAGIFSSSYIEATPLEAYRRTMEVNVFGHVAITKALIPLIPRGGRVLNMASIAGRVAMPGFSSYSMSKFAMEGFNDTLKREMMPFGVHVCCFEPIFARTPMVAALGPVQKRMWEEAPSEVKERYGQEFMDAHVAVMSSDDLRKSADPAQLGADAYFHAIGSPTPWSRYRVGFNASVFIGVTSLISTEMADAILLRSLKVKPKASLESK